MLIGFDASRAFVSEATGTENYSLNLLKALAKIDRKNQYRVYIREFAGPVSSFPPASARSRLKSVVDQKDNVELRAVGNPSRTATHKFHWPRNFVFVPVRPNRLWTQLGLALETWRNPVDVLFVPAHTLPILRRRKILNSKFEFRNTKQYLNSKHQNSKRLEHSDLENSNLFRNSDFVLRIFSFLSKKTKYVVTIHDLGVEYLPGYHSFPGRYYLDLASKYAAAHADGLIAVSKATRGDLVKRYGVNRKKVFVVPEGVDTHFFRPRSKKEIKMQKSKFKINGNYVLAVGTVQPRKNLEMLISAFKEVSGMVGKWDGRRKSEPTIPPSYRPTDLSLVIVGKLGWDYQRILDLPNKLGIGDRVRFLGYVAREDLPALYTGASVFAAPSLFEGFDLPILEALACGCTVIASDIGAHREIFRKVAGPVKKISNVKYKISNIRIGEAGILVKSKDVKQWTQILYQYVSLYNNRLTLVSKKGRIEAVRGVLGSKYSWENTAKETLKVFAQISLK